MINGNLQSADMSLHFCRNPKWYFADEAASASTDAASGMPSSRSHVTSHAQAHEENHRGGAHEIFHLQSNPMLLAEIGFSGVVGPNHIRKMSPTDAESAMFSSNDGMDGNVSQFSRMSDKSAVAYGTDWGTPSRATDYGNDWEVQEEEGGDTSSYDDDSSYSSSSYSGSEGLMRITSSAGIDDWPERHPSTTSLARSSKLREGVEVAAPPRPSHGRISASVQYDSDSSDESTDAPQRGVFT
jgi:hypothetical protein